ncbi:MAG TPA: ATP-binding cassette domain-containing protein [Chitinophagaceae bacterium]|nr:ATP-binding cassette domain-containing protein [Chitinophagaceae bacterium]
MGDIGLHQLLPIPLRDELRQKPSDIWNRDCTWVQGDCIHIRAPSGTGKTTLIHFLFRLRQDYEGKVLLGGEDLRTLGETQLARLRQRHFSIVFQDLRLFPALTTKENLEVKSTLTAPLPDSRIEHYADLLDLSGKLGDPAGRLSYGEQQRVAIIRSLLQPFDWILLDEPFSHLDRENIRKASGLITSVCKERAAGLILVDLEDDDHFVYTRKLRL